MEIFKLYNTDYEEVKTLQQYYMSAFNSRDFITSDNLPKYCKEGDNAYVDRLARTILFPFPEKVRNKIIKFIESKLDSSVNNVLGVEEFANDIDLQSSTIEDFTLKVLNRAIQVGRADVLMTAPLIDNYEIETLKEQEEAGIREYAILLDIGQIVAYEKDRFNNFEWVIIESIFTPAYLPKDDKPEQITQRTIFYRNGFEIYHKIGNEEKLIKSLTPYSNNIQEIPIFSIEFDDAILKDIIELSKRYMQVDSLTEDEFYRVLFDIFLIHADSREIRDAAEDANDDRVLLDISNLSCFTFTNSDDKPSILHSEIKNSQMKIEYLQELRKQISDISGIDFTTEKESYRFQSGESKKMDFIITNANLVALCRKASEFATDLLRYCGKLLNLSDEKIEQISITFPNDFNTRSINEQIIEIQNMINANAHPELIKYMWIKFINTNLKTNDINSDDIDKIIDSITNSVNEVPKVNFFG